MMKPYKHVCGNCDYFCHGQCVNCDSPSDCRPKQADEVCDGGGCGADCYGFVPLDKLGSPIDFDEAARMAALLARNVRSLGLGGRIENALLRNRIEVLAQLTRLTASEVAQLSWLGPKSAREIGDSLETIGLSLRKENENEANEN